MSTRGSLPIHIVLPIGVIDEVIYPDQTREKLLRAFAMLENKAAKLPKKKHGNIPL
jgi:propionyl-CoA carboxylase beta chain